MFIYKLMSISRAENVSAESQPEATESNICVDVLLVLHGDRAPIFFLPTKT